MSACFPSRPTQYPQGMEGGQALLVIFAIPTIILGKLPSFGNFFQKTTTATRWGAVSKMTQYKVIQGISFKYLLLWELECSLKSSRQIV